MSLRYGAEDPGRVPAARRHLGRANLIRSTLRGVLQECWRLGSMDPETYHRAIDVETVKVETLLAGRAFTGGELRALFDVRAEEEGPPGPRDAALLLGCGVRRAEAVALDLANFDRETAALSIRRGNGTKAQVVYAAGTSHQAIADWLGIRGVQPGPLLHPVAKGGRIRRCRLTSQAILWRVHHLADRARVARFSAHDARRTFISTLIDSGGDLVTVQRLAGHANVQTMARYDRCGEEAKKRAAGLVHIPNRRARP